MIEQRSRLAIKLASAERYLMWYAPPLFCNHIRIAEFPKSGGTWLSQMIAEMADLDFPRNQRMTWRRGVQHSHLPGPAGARKTVLMVRDGRDVCVSAYFHFLQPGREVNSRLVTQWRAHLSEYDISDVSCTMPIFIKMFFERMKIGGRSINWKTHLNSFQLDNPNLCIVKYEDLLFQPCKEMYRIADFLNLDVSQSKVEKVVDKYSFANQRKINSHKQDNIAFLRKGIAGDWKTHFTEEARLLFDSLAGHELQLLGYE
ncbi:MAG: sulfotransferase domain-containing protein [Bacteroidota bacterium]